MSRPSQTTEELIVQIKQGRDVEACFRLLFERYRNQVHRFFQRKGLSPEDCRELTQETFFSIYKGLNELRQPSQFISWMFAITENVWRSHLEMIKAKKRVATVVSLDQKSDTEEDDSTPLADRIPDPSPSPLEFALQQEKIEKLHAALEQLSPQRRRCLYLYVTEDFSYQEIAEFMGLTIGAVKAHLHQAKMALREKLKTDFAELELLGRAAREIE